MFATKFNLLGVGLGNIGSHAIPLLATDPRIGGIGLSDDDRYDQSNLAGQAIAPVDVGQLKVDAQAARLRVLRPELPIATYAERLEALPFGVFRSAGIVVSGLDSRRARLELNERVFRAGVRFWIDAGVSPDEGLARITVLEGRAANTQDRPCLECSWTAADYAALEQRYLCRAGNALPSTGASAELGQLSAAGIMAALDAILAGQSDGLNRETLTSLAGSRLLHTRLTRNPGCRFHHMPDREPDFVQKLSLCEPVGWFFERIAPMPGCGFRVEGAGAWVCQAGCADCGAPPVPCLHLAHRRPGLQAALRCSRCGSERLHPVGFESRPILWRDELGSERLDWSLASTGLRHGDEITFFRSRTMQEPVLRIAVAA